MSSDPGPSALWQPLHLPWQTSDSAGSPPRIRYWQDGGFLHWQIEAPLPSAPATDFPAPAFKEGLWEMDVAECFLANPATGSYTEYNLSPGGAWWAAAFTAPRVRRVPQPAPEDFGAPVSTVWHADHWQGTMRIPAPDFPAAIINFTAIVTTPAGRLFYSLCPLGGSLPDFHRPSEWRTVAGALLPPA